MHKIFKGSLIYFIFFYLAGQLDDVYWTVREKKKEGKRIKLKTANATIIEYLKWEMKNIVFEFAKIFFDINSLIKNKSFFFYVFKSSMCLT